MATVITYDYGRRKYYLVSKPALTATSGILALATPQENVNRLSPIVQRTTFEPPPSDERTAY